MINNTDKEINMFFKITNDGLRFYVLNGRVIDRWKYEVHNTDLGGAGGCKYITNSKKLSILKMRGHLE